ncbi:TlpA family protein disulfide reductase [bacterium]|nr:TlpA family protein disulfide reductase [candidate division CSSED10-310 bacterium]
MKKFSVMVLLIALASGLCLADKYSQDDLFTKLRASGSTEEANAVFSDFVKNAPNLELAQGVYQMWEANAGDDARACLESMKADPASVGRLRYFEGAAKKNLADRIASARQVIAADANAFDGYALLFDTYTTWLFGEPLGDRPGRSGPSDEDLKRLKDGFNEDNLKMVRIKEWKDAGEYVNPVTRYMAYYAAYKNHPDDMYKYMKEGEAMGADWIDYSHLAVAAVRMGRIDEGKTYIDKYVDLWISRGAVQENQRADMTDSMVRYALVYGRAYDEAIAHIKAKPEYADNADNLYNLAAICALKGATDAVFEHLNLAIAKGFSDTVLIAEDTDFTAYRTDPRWAEITGKVKENWDAGDAQRSKDAVALKIDLPAPEWTLSDPTGKSYALADYKGKKVVVLDFWATWCGPCMMAMPKLDEWCKNEKPEHVEVFSINTWERKPDEAKKMFTDRKFSMTLLMDGDTVAQNYKVSGIPYICLIDKDGHIRYEMKGFSPELEQNLTYWVKDLLK